MNWNGARHDIASAFADGGSAGHADHADPGARDRGTETKSRPSPPAGTPAAAKHPPDQCLGIAGDFDSVRIHCRRACPSACRSSGRTGEKPGFCSWLTPTSRRPAWHKREPNTCPDPRITFRTIGTSTAGYISFRQRLVHESRLRRSSISSNRRWADRPCVPRRK